MPKNQPYNLSLGLSCDSATCPFGYEMIGGTGGGGLGSDIPGCGLEGGKYNENCDVRINIAYNPTECALQNQLCA